MRVLLGRSTVMRGLGPRIHAFPRNSARQKDVDGRAKPGHDDEVMEAYGPYTFSNRCSRSHELMTF